MEKAEDAQHQKRAETFMRLALAQAERAHELGEVPVGCVVVYCGSDESGELASCKPDTVIGTGFNRTNITHNATRHAEFEAVDMILMRSGGRYTTDIFKHCELFVTVEPCIMCAAALAQLGIGRYLRMGAREQSQEE
eukprot:g634.t1